MKRLFSSLCIGFLGLCLATSASAQTFSSGSDGSDGNLAIAGGQGNIAFTTQDLNGDGVYHYGTITIGAGTTVRIDSTLFGEGLPIVWLASGAVNIDGDIDLDGSDGHSTSSRQVPIAGAGGYNGGRGNDEALSYAAEPGNGPGGGPAPSEFGSFNGVGAGHLQFGADGAGGRSYGNLFLLPLIGGSGGSGANISSGVNTGKGVGGGAGGGAMLIASSATLTLNGNITANGGRGIVASRNGGHGSGGAIRLMAQALAGFGTLEAKGASGSGGTKSSDGRIRLEAFSSTQTYSVTPAFTAVTAPGPVFVPANAPKIQVTKVNSVNVASPPTGSAETPDVTINASTSVTVEVVTQNIPVGTQLDVTIQPQTGASVVVSVNVAGPVANSTQSVTALIPNGVSRVSVKANWTP